MSYKKYYKKQKKGDYSPQSSSEHSFVSEGEHFYSEPYVAQNMKRRKLCYKKKKNKHKKYGMKEDNVYQSGKKKNRRFNFFRFHKYKKTQNMFLDARDCNTKTESSTFQDLCQKHYKVAKDVSKSIYNKLLHNYNYAHSFSTVVYSDRYFIYNLTLNAKIVPSKGLITNDINPVTVYKRFSRSCSNYIKILDIENQSSCDLNSPHLKHYMPIFTNWSIQPYTLFCGILHDFTDRLNLSGYSDRRHYYYSFVDIITKMNEFNHLIFPNYKPAIDMVLCSKDLLDYDDYAYSHSKFSEISQHQIKTLLYYEKKPFDYRMSQKGTSSISRFTESEINLKRKTFKKSSSYGKIYTKTFVSKFPIPDFALSQDELVQRWKNAIYEKNKAFDKEIYEKLYKSKQQVSLSNLILTEPETKNKVYEDKKKALFSQKKSKNNKFDYEPEKVIMKNFNIDVDVKSNDVANLSRNMNNMITPSYQDRNNALMMEPLLFIQNLNEERRKNKLIASKKAQRLMVHIIIGYTISFILLSLLSFYVMYFT